MIDRVEMDILSLLDVYNCPDPISLTEGNSLHLLCKLCSPVSQFAAIPDLVVTLERQLFNVEHQDTVAMYLAMGALYEEGHTAAVVGAILVRPSWFIFQTDCC